MYDNQFKKHPTERQQCKASLKATSKIILKKIKHFQKIYMDVFSNIFFEKPKEFFSFIEQYFGENLDVFSHFSKDVIESHGRGNASPSETKALIHKNLQQNTDFVVKGLQQFFEDSCVKTTKYWQDNEAITSQWFRAHTPHKRPEDKGDAAFVIKTVLERHKENFNTYLQTKAEDKNYSLKQMSSILEIYIKVVRQEENLCNLVHKDLQAFQVEALRAQYQFIEKHQEQNMPPPAAPVLSGWELVKAQERSTQRTQAQQERAENEEKRTSEQEVLYAQQLEAHQRETTQQYKITLAQGLFRHLDLRKDESTINQLSEILKGNTTLSVKDFLKLVKKLEIQGADKIIEKANGNYSVPDNRMTLIFGELDGKPLSLTTHIPHGKDRDDQTPPAAVARLKEILESIGINQANFHELLGRFSPQVVGAAASAAAM